MTKKLSEKLNPIGLTFINVNKSHYLSDIALSPDLDPSIYPLLTTCNDRRSHSQISNMSNLEYTTPAGHGQDNLKNYRYNQVVRVGDVLHISGQGASNLYPRHAYTSMTLRKS